ncbi:MAG: mycofactocin-coupled SDR family oxidoreductase [Acidimicrobiia bacterium]
MNRLQGKVALISGGARGQGRSHALRLASEGADIITFDLPTPPQWLGYDLADAEDLAETVRQVEALDRRIVARPADVRDSAAIKAVVAEGVQQFGHIDIVCANAGIGPLPTPFWEIPDDVWQDTLDINLTGVWRTVSAAVPHMIDAGRGGSIIVTSSAAGVRGASNIAAYVAAKRGVIALTETMARELSRHRIRVNAVAPTNVNTDMLMNDVTFSLFRPDLESPSVDDVRPAFQRMNLLPEPWVEAADISAAVAFLASDDARYITGHVLPVDLGGVLK